MDNITSYSYAFNTAFTHLLKVEGGYVNDPNDNGGETRYGISKRAHPDVDIANLTVESAKKIYWHDYWLANRCDQLPDPLAIAMFDGCVNHRASTGRRLMQRALGVSADGVIGPQTIAAAKKANCQPVLVEYCAQRTYLYHQLIIANSGQAKFALGWFRRACQLLMFIRAECWPYKF